MVLFVVLPIRLETQGDIGETLEGTHAGSPSSNFSMKRKIRMTTLWAVPVWAVIAAVILFGDISVRDIDMFNRMETPILGIIENMAAFTCDECGKTHHPFGHGGARAEAERLQVPFLGEIPLTLGIREAGDAGTPIVVAKPESDEAEAFWSLADTLIETTLAKA